MPPTTFSCGTNFSPAEIACRGTGKLLLDGAVLDRLQALRDRLGKPLIVRSAYRSTEHNRAVGGATRSKYLDAGQLSTFSFLVAARLSRRIGPGSSPSDRTLGVSFGTLLFLSVDSPHGGGEGSFPVTRAEEITWSWRVQTIRLGVSRLGDGPTILLLPALSSISTRLEMRPLLQQLANRFSTVAVDWPGFGDLPRPALAWTPEAYEAFLAYVLSDIAPSPLATVACGHAGGYALRHAAAAPRAAGLLCFVAPTWRGPLPTMAGRRHAAFARIAAVGDWPFVGAALYRLNVNRPVMNMMVRGHVYADPDWLTEERIAEKLAVIRAPGARHASIRFVTGQLDPFTDRDSFLEAARSAASAGPMLLVYGGDTPPKSRAEMEALAAVPGVRRSVLPHGKLSVHEEFPAGVAEAIEQFIQDTAESTDPARAAGGEPDARGAGRA